MGNFYSNNTKFVGIKSNNLIGSSWERGNETRKNLLKPTARQNNVKSLKYQHKLMLYIPYIKWSALTAFSFLCITKWDVNTNTYIFMHAVQCVYA